MKYPVIANSDGRDNVFIASVLDALKVFLKKNGTIEYIETIYFSLTKTRLEKLPDIFRGARLGSGDKTLRMKS